MAGILRALGGLSAAIALGIAAGTPPVLPLTSRAVAGSGPSISADGPVTATDSRRGDTARNSPSLAADPTDSRFVAIANRIDGPVYGCELQLSGDSGRTWISAHPVAALPPGAEQCYAPEVAFGPSGVLHYLFVGLQGPGHHPMGVFLTSSSDRGRSFSSPIELLGPDNFQVGMAIDQGQGSMGRIHLVWLHVTGPLSLGGLPPTDNPILASHSDDDGRTFSTPVPVSDRDRAHAVAPALAVGPDHAVHVAYYDLGRDAVDYQGLEGGVYDGRWSLVHSTSTDGGLHFDRGTVVDADLVPPERVMLIYTMPPAALAAGAGGRVVVAWYDARNGDWDVFVRRSTDGGRSWEPPRRLNDDPLHNGRHQYLPQLSMAPNGRLDAIFSDRRNDPHNVRNDVYYTYSSDSGATFAPTVRLTSESSSTLIGQVYAVPSARGLVEFGSRLGLLARDDASLAAWTDTRNSLGGDIPTPGYIEQAIFSARVEFASEAAPRSWWPTGLGAVVVAAGAAFILLRWVRRRTA